MEVTLDKLFELLAERGLWLAVIVCDEEPQPERIVAALKGGALDYLQLPLDQGRLARSLRSVVEEADAQSRARQRLTEARRKVVSLSKREREVLELLAIGSSNKLIARELSISPRTVEIHRSNMMTKLRAEHSSEAVRIWLEAELEPTVSLSLEDRRSEEDRALATTPDFVRMIRQRMPDVVEEFDGNEDSVEETRASRRARSR
jgi:FixJ family two-component response regulator